MKNTTMKNFALLLAIAASASALELTADNFMAETAGKSVLIKFFAPWCEHCKKLKPDWDELMAAFAGDPSRLVADVDCTAYGGRPLCEANGVTGYPAIKWGDDPADLRDYEYKRTLETLTKFVRKGLKPPECSAARMDLCDDGERAQIARFRAMPAGELEAGVAAGEKRLADAKQHYEMSINQLNAYNTALEQWRDKAVQEKLMKREDAKAKYKTEVDDLQEQYAELNKDKERVAAELRAEGLGRMKSVLEASNASKAGYGEL